MRRLLASAILAVFAGFWGQSASAADLYSGNHESFFSNDDYWDWLSNKESRACDDPHVLESQVVFLAWVYYSSQILFFGAEVVRAGLPRERPEAGGSPSG